jgi:acetyltransferase-like isoleucine patch superfamily enzyme
MIRKYVKKLGYKFISFFVPEIAILKTNENWFSEIILKHEIALIYNLRNELGHCGRDVNLHYPITVFNPQNVYLFDNTNIYENSTILTVKAKFIMKKNSGAAQGLTVVTGNHSGKIGVWYKELIGKEDEEKDILVEEDVWIGTNVTLLAGVKIGRGSIIGAGSLCRKSIPPYAIVVGNPAKIVGFRFNPVEVIEHEKKLYLPDERLSKEELEKNYNKYSIDSLNGIQDYLKLSCSK